MNHPDTSSEIPNKGVPKKLASLVSFWICVVLILIIGLCSITGRQWGMTHNYGVYGGYAHFPIIWLGGFAIFPGYIHGLIQDSLSFRGDWVLCSFVAVFMLLFYLTTILWSFKCKDRAMKIFAISYLLSLGINFFNFIFVGLLHI